MVESENTELELVLIVDRSGRILKGELGGRELPKRLIKGTVLIRPEDESEKLCKIFNGAFCCKPKVAGIPLCP
jgi:hypothetical protein